MFLLSDCCSNPHCSDTCCVEGQSRLLPVAGTFCPLLSAFLSGLIPLRGNLWICGRQVFTSMLETDDNLSATNAPGVITKTVM